MTDLEVAAAVDFGTYGTGFAWADLRDRDRASDPRTIHHYDRWRNQPASYIKTRTSLLLRDGDIVAWGYEADRRRVTAELEQDGLSYRDRFKLGLGDPVEATARAAERDITAYLSAFYDFALRQITGDMSVGPEQIRWCITVPAMWSDQQRGVMRQAAHAAGFPSGTDRLLLAVESEMAALYCHYHSERTDFATEGKSFLVVDAGGGTVDITAYRVDGVGQLVQLGVSPGGRCGSTYVDKLFMTDLLPRRLPMAVLERVFRKSPQVAYELRGAWERAKHGWDPDRDAPTELPLPVPIYAALDPVARRHLADAQNQVSDWLILQPQEMRDLFDVAVDEIEELVGEQIRRVGSVDTVLLVGGFAQSKYLRQRLGDAVGVNVVVPRSPSGAVLSGAVHYCLRPETVVARCSSFTYGLRISSTVDPEHRGDLERRFVDGWGEERCDNRFDIYVRRGDVVPAGYVVTKTFFPAHRTQDALTFAVFASRRENPRYTDELGVFQIGTLEVEIGEVTKLPRNDQRIELAMEFGGTEIRARAKVVRTGELLNTTFRFERAWG
ncbi:Hsp70 family protein [Nocardia mexicana]|uniref:Hsp70 protein n=1 Tax=Nocardia mexicana TaxID=279262 RepID=A0A370H3I6_9NOCA|nr:Hsp70 family protein [Nocardia mexicana]RDI50799.1 Hsp70 protein [Nocardia mexicana]